MRDKQQWYSSSMLELDGMWTEIALVALHVRAPNMQIVRDRLREKILVHELRMNAGEGYWLYLGEIERYLRVEYSPTEIGDSMKIAEFLYGRRVEFRMPMLDAFMGTGHVDNTQLPVLVRFKLPLVVGLYEIAALHKICTTTLDGMEEHIRSERFIARKIANYDKKLCVLL